MVVIRQAVETDRERLATLMQEYIVKFCEQPDPSRKALTLHIKRLLNNPSYGIQFVAELEGKLVGFATVYVSWSTHYFKETAVLKDLYVSPLNRGNKIGERLFKICLAYSQKYEIAGMTAECSSENKVAQNLYQKMNGKENEGVQYRFF